MEGILLVTHSMTIRKPLTFAIVVLIAALAPVAAIIGFCARMPCCFHESSASLAFATERTDCCTTITCYESPSAKMTKAVSSGVDAVAAPAIIATAWVAPPAPPVFQVVADTSPPLTVRHRLAALSILLI
jgi:hypothetical protein